VELETNSEIKNIRNLCRAIVDFKKGYQPRNFIVKDEKGDLVAIPTVGGGNISHCY
jgi:hypothetical protein